MSIGKVKLFNAEHGFDFVRDDDDAEVFFHVLALPKGAVAPKPGTRVEYGAADGHKGPQVLTVKILSLTRSVSAARRHKSQAMALVVEDLIKLLDASPAALRSRRYPESPRVIVKVLRAVADDFDV